MHDIPKETLLKAMEGDLDSFEIIYRATSGFVYNAAYRIVHNRQDAEEVTQEVFLVIYHQLKKFRLESSLKTWVYRIAVNCAINRSRKVARETKRKKEHGEHVTHWQAADSPYEGREQESESINAFLKILNPDQRACMVLRNIEGLSYQEIADTLRISINTVRTRLKRAREKLLTMRREVVKNEL